MILKVGMHCTVVYGKLLGVPLNILGSVSAKPVTSKIQIHQHSFTQQSEIFSSIRGIILLCSDLESYEKARLKLKQAEVTSDLQTEAEEDMSQPKRKKR